MLIHTKDFDTGKALVEALGHSKTPWRSMEGLAAIKADPSAKVKAAIAHVRAKFGPDSITIEAERTKASLHPRTIQPTWTLALLRGEIIDTPYRTYVAKREQR